LLTAASIPTVTDFQTSSLHRHTPVRNFKILQGSIAT